MFRILLATDGSPYALGAADFTATLAKRIAEAQVTILYVVDTSILTAMAGSGLGMTVTPAALLPEELEKVGASALQVTQERLAAAGVQVATRLERGRPAEAICSVAEREHFDMIVVGSSGMGHITGIFLGSVSDKVTHRARVPVVIVRGSAEM